MLTPTEIAILLCVGMLMVFGLVSIVRAAMKGG